MHHPEKNEASTVLVRIEPGIVMTGWAIRTDVVLVRASGVTDRASVHINGKDISPLAYHEATENRLEAWEPLTALQLPPGSLPVTGDAYPPGLVPDHDPDRAWRPLWCLIFPNLPGC